MPQYWLKPMGVTRPVPDPMPDEWTAGRDLSRFDVSTGPNTPRQPPQMGRGDQVLLHAVVHARVFAQVEILGNPRWELDPVYGDRWPWIYRCKALVWVPRIGLGPPTAEIAPERALGRIQRGGEFARLEKAEFESMRERLVSATEAQISG